MKNYKSYMDRITVPEEFHQKLLGLEELERPSRRPVWQKYGALAACAVLLIGVGVYGVSRLGTWDGLATGPSVDAGPVQCAAPDMSDETETIDLAPEDPDSVEPGMATIPGFEVRENRAGVDVVSYYMLPWIDYGSKDAAVSSVSLLDYAAPEDSTWRELTREDILALVGGEGVLNTMLDWGGFEFTGSATFDADGTVWQMGFAGKRDDFCFNLELAPDALPLTCIIMEPHTVTEIWGVEVTGRYGGIHGEGPDREVWMPESREVEFIANGVGCRFTLYGLEGQSDAVETMVSRFVRLAILEGLDLSALTPDGTSVPIGDGFSDAPYDAPADAGAAPSVAPQEANPAADGR